MRTAAKRDENEGEIIQALRKAGYFVTQINGRAVPDLLVIKPATNAPVYTCIDEYTARACAGMQPMCMIEVKMPKMKLNDYQRVWHDRALNKHPDGES